MWTKRIYHVVIAIEIFWLLLPNIFKFGINVFMVGQLILGAIIMRCIWVAKSTLERNNRGFLKTIGIWQVSGSFAWLFGTILVVIYTSINQNFLGQGYFDQVIQIMISGLIFGLFYFLPLIAALKAQSFLKLWKPRF